MSVTTGDFVALTSGRVTDAMLRNRTARSEWVSPTPSRGQRRAWTPIGTHLFEMAIVSPLMQAGLTAAVASSLLERRLVNFAASSQEKRADGKRSAVSKAMLADLPELDPDTANFIWAIHTRFEGRNGTRPILEVASVEVLQTTTSVGAAVRDDDTALLFGISTVAHRVHAYLAQRSRG